MADNTLSNQLRRLAAILEDASGTNPGALEADPAIATRVKRIVDAVADGAVLLRGEAAGDANLAVPDLTDVDDTTSPDSGEFLRGDGTAWSNSVIQVGDLPSIDHGNLTGLTDDDHTQYFLAAGTRNITGNFQLNRADTNLGQFSIVNQDNSNGQMVGQIRFAALNSVNAAKDYSVIGTRINTSTSGSEDGRIVFRLNKSGGAFSDTIEFRGSGTTFKHNVNVQGEMMGSRLLITMGINLPVSGNTYYMGAGNVQMDANAGILMHRAGSIVGVGWRGECTTYAATTSVATVVSASGGSSMTSGLKDITSTTFFDDYAIASRGTNTFNAGEYLTAEFTFSGGAITMDTIIGVIEIVFDT